MQLNSYRIAVIGKKMAGSLALIVGPWNRYGKYVASLVAQLCKPGSHRGQAIEDHTLEQ